MKKHKYEIISDAIEQQILDEVFIPGDKAPSLRILCSQFGVSQNTAMAVYYELEAKGFVESRPKSGYFISRAYKKWRVLPSTSRPRTKEGRTNIEELTERIFNQAGPDHIQLSQAVPANELLPVAKLNKAMVVSTRTLKEDVFSYTKTQGNEKLRRHIVRHAHHIPDLNHEDIITTNGCTNALSYALMALTQAGDSIAVESPVYFGILRIAQTLHLKIIELPTHPVTGIELEALKKLLEKKTIQVFVLISNFSNPLGSMMPDEHKREVVRLSQKYHVPVIEDDVYGDLYFGSQRPNTCRSFDESGLVLLCNSFSKTLAPGYRVGWIAPGKFKSDILNLKQSYAISSANITEEVIANFLEAGRYEHHLRKLRRALLSNSVQYMEAIDQYFPENTKISKPQGGLVLWIEFGKQVNTMEVFEDALRTGISIAPGKMFTVQQQFNNCLRLNFGIPMNNKILAALKTIGRLVKSY